ncbi:MAG: hypothetical protein GF410_03090 [Chitinivibrionales bacterium]|nr:hypothetical protein [Chitinivibrionales bacterium]
MCSFKAGQGMWTAVLCVFVFSVLSQAVTVEDATDEGKSSWKITGTNAVWHLQKENGGLSSMLDNQDNDWISFNNAGGASGKYRGIPNAVHPGNVFHPGYNTNTCAMDASSDENKVTINCQTSNEGGWAATWEFFDTHARFIMTQKSRAYWVLYEGTPGGSYSSSDWWMTSSVTSPQNCTSHQDGDIPDPEWIVFGDPGLDRVLFLHHLQDDSSPDKYYDMSPMTVFGFGRSGLSKYLNTVPDTFHFGFIESTDHGTITDAIDALAEGGSTDNVAAFLKSNGKSPVAVHSIGELGLSIVVHQPGSHRLAIHDLAGRMVWAKSSSKADSYIISDGRLAKGAYVLRAWIGTTVRTHNLVVH